jgi:serine/threonine-protein kinase
VYLAWDRDLARHVAVKVLLPELAHHPGMSQRFLQEARTAANLDDHPCVVRVYRAKEAAGLRFFVMKFVDGCSLEQLLRTTGALPAELAAHVVDQVAQALQYAHEHGVVHRDVKPGNILLDRAGGVVVTDFGIAKVAEAESLTRTGLAIGTPHYMSPEQWRVEPVTAASDQYALGVVAHHAVTGGVPFDGTQYEIQEGHLRLEPRALSELRPGVPPALDAVVSVMLAKRADERFPDLHNVSRALAAVPRDLPGTLRAHLAARVAAAVPEGTPVRTPSGVTPHRLSPAARATPAANTPVTPGPVPPPVPSAPAPPPAAGPTATLAIAPSAVPPPAPAAAVGPDTATPARPLEAPLVADTGPRMLTSADEPLPPPRRRSRAPVLAAAGLLAAVGAGVVLTRSRGDATPPADGAAAAAAVAAPAAASTPAAAPPDTAALPAPPVATTIDSAALAATAAASAAAAAEDTAVAPAPPPASAGPRVATTLLVVGAPPGGRAALLVGDSLRLRARVNDARGARMVEAVVQWASSDPARVAFRGGWAVALAPGGPVEVTATSGALRRTVQVEAAPRPAAVAAAPAGPAAGPSEAEVQQAVQGFVAALRARDADALGRRLDDGAAGREFLAWMRTAKRFGVDAPAAGAVSTAGGVPRVAVRVPIRYDRGGLIRGVARRDATFYLTLARDGGEWHAGRATLAERFTP